MNPGAHDHAEGDFLAKSNDLKTRLAAAEEALIESLSRTEWEAPSTSPK